MFEPHPDAIRPMPCHPARMAQALADTVEAVIGVDTHTDTRSAWRPCGRAATPHPEHQAGPAVVSMTCSSSPYAADTPSSRNPGNPSMAVPALPSSLTWGLLRRVLDTAILRPQAQLQTQERSTCRAPDHAS